MYRCKLLLAATLLAAATASASAQSVNRYPTRPATFTTPFVHPTAPTTFDYAPYGQTFRWGWFGATHYGPAPQMHRTYNQGWKEWHLRR